MENGTDLALREGTDCESGKVCGGRRGAWGGAGDLEGRKLTLIIIL